MPNKARLDNPNIVFAETQTIDYNIRGWWNDSKAYNKLDITNIQSNGNVTAATPNFEHGLRYNLNGNIKESRWEGNGGQDYTYDSYNRLISAKGKLNSPTKFDETISYDVNGNIETLLRTNAFGFTIDDLKYKYKANNPNQLDYVSDLAVSITNENDEANQGFPKGMGSLADFTYDENGNLLKDTRRGITTTYNLLNLVNTVSFTGKTQSQSYKYAADGTKLSFTSAQGIDKSYIGAVEYNTGGGVLRIGTEEGHVMLRPLWNENSKDSKYVYYYTIKDHLGNVRMVLDDDANANVWQKTDYNAFGLDAKNDFPQGISAGKERNNHLYNDKESDPETTRLDYGARQYDNVLGRWFVVDPLAEIVFNLSPYTYVNNSPILLIDPDGMLSEKTPDYDPNKHNPNTNGTLLEEVKVTAKRNRGNTNLLVYNQNAEMGMNLTKNNFYVHDKNTGVGVFGNLDKGDKQYFFKNKSEEVVDSYSGELSKLPKTFNPLVLSVIKSNLKDKIASGDLKFMAQIIKTNNPEYQYKYTRSLSADKYGTYITEGYTGALLLPTTNINTYTRYGDLQLGPTIIQFRHTSAPVPIGKISDKLPDAIKNMRETPGTFLYLH